jgi:putative tricarboxylic transport membrane protein
MGFLQGFEIAFELQNLFYCFVGVFVGTLVGVLPGIGPSAAMALLLPLTYKMSALGAIIMLAGIYYGAMYGGSTTSILVNIPGEAASVMTTLDGYQMAQQGRAGPALGIAAFGSFIAGTISVLGLTLIAGPLVQMALKFGPPEYFSLMALGLIILIHLSGGSVAKGFMMGLVGLLLSFIGLDAITGVPRFNLGTIQFMDGIGLVPLMMGLFGVGEVLVNLERPEQRGHVVQAAYKELLPSLKDWKDSIWAILRGSTVGFFLGVLPGGGATISSFAAYGLERKISKQPEKFGKGAIEGLAAPEAANNAAVGGSMIPLLSLGIPTNGIIALLLGALIIHGLRPGPELLTKNPDVFWGFVASMYIGNAMLLLLNLPLIWIWVQILKIPYRLLFPLILLFTIVGSYSIQNSLFDVKLMIFFGLAGYLLRKFKYELSPLIMAFVLGPMLEEALRQSLIMSRGSFDIFISRPLSLAFLIVAAITALSSFTPIFRRLYIDSGGVSPQEK